MPTAGTITPANVSFSLGGKQIPITDAKINITLSNGCQYTECVLETGKKGYILTKGGEVKRQGDFRIQTIKTADSKSNDAIEELEKTHKLAYKNDDPKEYNKDVTFSLLTPGGKVFSNISFQGFIKEYMEFDPVGTEFPKREALIDLYDPQTLQLTGG